MGGAALRATCGDRSRDRSASRNITVSTAPVPFPWNGISHPMKWDADYRRLASRLDDERGFESQEHLERVLEALRINGAIPGYQPLPPSASEADLAEVLPERMRMEFLVDGLDERNLTVAPGEGSGEGGARRLDLAFDDPWVGRFEVLLLLPPGAGPFPAVVTHPGHFEAAADHVALHYGADFPAAGIALAVVTPRVNDSFPLEDSVSRALLLAGTTFMAVRIYDLLLVRKYLRCRADVDPERIGLLGHSGGATVGNVAVRMDDGWKAYVGDNTGDYLNWDHKSGTVLDETAPALHPLFPLINNFELSPTPILMLEYGYGETSDEMVGFFLSKL